MCGPRALNPAVNYACEQSGTEVASRRGGSRMQVNGRMDLLVRVELVA